MTVADLISHLQNFKPSAKVWISDQQGGGGEANFPYKVREPDQFNSGEIPTTGDAVMSYENT